MAPSSTTVSPLAMDAALHDFRQRYPGFDATATLDAMRATEYRRLDTKGHIYLDYTGGGLYAESQLRRHMDLLANDVFGNPHSSNPTSHLSTQVDEQARRYVLEYFNALPDEYVAIFTLNASGALKLVGESYPFTPRSRYLLTFDNHNSVNGIREFARARNASVTYVPVVLPELRTDEERLFQELGRTLRGTNNLFAYPAQSNFSGVQHPLEWIGRAQERGWDVLVDASAFAPTNRLDLSVWKPDYVPMSFYKMFGYPTGIGALLARKTALAKLRRPWFAGGTITMASVQGDGHFLADGEAGFEDGTINYLNIPAVEIGLRHLAAIGIDTIHARVECLTGWLLDELSALRHASGAPLVRIYGPTDTQMRGGTVTVNFYDPQGKLYDCRWVEQQANAVNISLRTGVFCNPGAGEVMNGLTQDDMQRYCHGTDRMSFEQFIEAMDGKASGAVRISVGLATTFGDVYRFVEFVKGFVV